MFPFLRQHFRLLSIWTIASAFLLFANPWVSFGAAEICALVGPFILGINRRVRREFAFATGLPLIAMLCLLSPANAVALRLIIASIVFVAGVVLADRLIESQRNLESIAGQVAFAPPDSYAFAEFERSLEREFGRARRHAGHLVLLSVAPHPAALELEGSQSYPADLLVELAENRARLELSELLTRELHVYSDVVAARDRVLALVPEVEESAVSALVERVRDAAAAALQYEVQVGVGCFPRDAVSVEALIATADRDRTNSMLRRLPDRFEESEPELDEPDGFAREVQS